MIKKNKIFLKYLKDHRTNANYPGINLNISNQYNRSFENILNALVISLRALLPHLKLTGQ